MRVPSANSRRSDNARPATIVRRGDRLDGAQKEGRANALPICPCEFFSTGNRAPRLVFANLPKLGPRSCLRELVMARGYANCRTGSRGFFASHGIFAPAPVLDCSNREPARSNAPLRVFPAAPAREPERGADRLAPLDAARRDDPAIIGRDLFLAAVGVARLEARRADRARGAGPLRRAGDPDADDPAGRALARKRTLRRLRQGDAAHQGPP